MPAQSSSPVTDEDVAVDALQRTLHHPEYTWRTPVLDLPTALRELQHWRFRGHHRSRFDEIALIEDYQAARKSLGKSTEKLLRTYICDLDFALMSRRRDTAKVHSLATALLNTLTSPTVCAAAWDDYVSEIIDAGGDLEAISTTLRNFLSIAETCGHESDNLGIRSTLRHILEANVKLIEHSCEQVGWKFTPGKTYSAQERIDLCREVILHPNETADNIVWMTYVRARADADMWQVAQFTFYKASWLAEACETRNGNFALLPAEVQASPEDYSQYPEEPIHGDCVFIRAEMPTTTSADPISIARRNVEAILAVFGGRQGSAWSFFSAKHLIDGEPVASNAHRPEFLLDLDASRINPASYSMSQHGSTVFGAHFEATSNLVRTLELAGNLDKLEISEALKTPIITTHLLEHLNVLAGSEAPWWKFLDDTFKSGWTWTELIQELANRVRAIEHAGDAHAWLKSGDDSSKLADLLATIPERRAIFDDLHLLADTAIELIKILDPRWLPARELNRSCQIISDIEKKRRRARNRCDEEFDTRLARLKRYRDCITHGTEVDKTGVKSIFDFGRKLAIVGRNIHVTSATDQQGFADYLSKHVDISEDKLRDAENNNIQADLWW